MASGVINGFFRRNVAGQPLRALANVENLNKVANILNDITGQGCFIDKPLNGDPWVVRMSEDESGEEPLVRQKVLQCEVSAANSAVYREQSENLIWPQNVDITVNGIAVAGASEMHRAWNPTAGLKYMYIYQHFSEYRKDEDDQYISPPTYLYATTDADAYYNDALIAKVPYCRVDIPVVGEAPHIQCLLEGPLRIYAYRGDADQRAYAPTPANPLRQIQKSKTIDNSSGGSLPIKVRNLNAAADGYYNAYPHGRYHIVTEGGVDEVEWYEPEEPEQTKNDSKLLLLRYLYPQNNIPHGLPYWQTINQFLSNAETWLEDYIGDELEDDKAWLITILSPLAWEVWAENPGPYQPVLESDIEEGVQVEAAVMDKNGNWHSIFDILVSQDDLDITIADYDDLEERVYTVESQAESCYDDGDTATTDADNAAQTIAAFSDYSAQSNAIENSATSLEGHSGRLLSDLDALEARIAALEQGISQ